MASYIEKIEARKKRKKKSRRNMGIMSVIGAYYAAHVSTVINLSPRFDLSEALSGGLNHALMAPLEYRVTPGHAAIIASAISAGWLFHMFRETDREGKENEDPANAKLMDAEMLKAYQKKRCDPIGKDGVKVTGSFNVIYSKDIFLSMDGYKTKRNCNSLIIGASGAGKTRYFAAPNILQYNCNFVITDPSGELLEDYGKALENAGYEVLVFNVQDPYRSIRYNPFHYIHTQKDVFILVDTLIKNTTPPDSHKGDPIWENGEKLLLEAIILYLWHKAPEERQTFGNVIELVTMAKIEENESSGSNSAKLDELFDDLEQEDPDNLAVKQYKLFKLAAGKTLQSFLISVATRLQSFSLPDMDYLTSRDEFQFEKFSDTKKALFVIIPTGDSTFNFIVSMLYSHLFLSLYEYVETRAKFGWQAVIGERNVIKVAQAPGKAESAKAKKEIKEFIASCKEGCTKKWNEKHQYFEVYNSKNELVGWRGTEKAADRLIESLPKMRLVKCERHCPNHVRFILDEFANISQIPNFEKILSTVRKYWLSCAIIIQALSQLKEIYRDTWSTIIGNCDTKLILGCEDPETVKWIVEMMGKKTVRVKNTTYQVGKTGGGSEGYNKQAVELFPYEAVTGLEEDECLVKIRGVPGYHGKKYEVSRHPNYASAMKLKGQFEVPIDKEIEEKRKNDLTPLRLRQDSKRQALFDKEQGTSDKGAEEMSDADLEKKNQERKETAEKDAAEAKAALDKMDADTPAPEMSEQTAADLLANFGLDKNATEEQIAEAAESLLFIDQPSMEVLTYGITA